MTYFNEIFWYYSYIPLEVSPISYFPPSYTHL